MEQGGASVRVAREGDRYAQAGGFVRYDNLAGASFIDSPLVRREHYFAAGLAATWLIGESSRRVDTDDDD